jgi:hypothetical protein
MAPSLFRRSESIAIVTSIVSCGVVVEFAEASAAFGDTCFSVEGHNAFW